MSADRCIFLRLIVMFQNKTNGLFLIFRLESLYIIQHPFLTDILSSHNFIVGIIYPHDFEFPLFIIIILLKHKNKQHE